MMSINRRHLILGTAALALSAGAGLAQSTTIDLTKLSEPSVIGEMALGPETAKVTLIEYASASCPHCAAFYKTAFQDLRKEYIDTGKIRFVFREFPHNQEALAAFMLARCVPKEKYFPVVEMFFLQQEQWLPQPATGLFKIAQLAGMTKESFDACLKNETVAKGIVDVRNLAEQKFGVEGIPTFFLNGKRYEGDNTIESFRKAIDPLLG